MISVGFVVVGPDGAPRTVGERRVMRWAVLPATELHVLPTWNAAAGLRGSGSHDVLAEGVFVPVEHTLMPFFEPPQASGALYRVPFFTAVRSLRTEYAPAAQFATRSAAQAVNVAFEAAGVSSALAGDVIQRCWRDVNVAGQHIAFSRGRWRGAGQALLRLEIDPFYL
jgi:alkylation response protein AidB-like acyl-CoA dehydrogenase